MTKMNMEDYIEHRIGLEDKLGIVSKIDYISKINIDASDRITCFLDTGNISFRYNSN